jgi:hypothetical protein
MTLRKTYRVEARSFFVGFMRALKEVGDEKEDLKEISTRKINIRIKIVDRLNTLLQVIERSFESSIPVD